MRSWYLGNCPYSKDFWACPSAPPIAGGFGGVPPNGPERSGHAFHRWTKVIAERSSDFTSSKGPGSEDFSPHFVALRGPHTFAAARNPSSVALFQIHRDRPLQLLISGGRSFAFAPCPNRFKILRRHEVGHEPFRSAVSDRRFQGVRRAKRRPARQLAIRTEKSGNPLPHSTQALRIRGPCSFRTAVSDHRFQGVRWAKRRPARQLAIRTEKSGNSLPHSTNYR
jgi:hypothetical protein